MLWKLFLVSLWSHALYGMEAPSEVDKVVKDLAASLGASFEILGGEMGKAEILSKDGEPCWFAKVRAKKIGEFGVSYRVTLKSTEFEYIIPIKVVAQGERRTFSAGGWGTSAYPHGNVGDTIIVPLHLPLEGKDHTVKDLPKANKVTKAFFTEFERHWYTKVKKEQTITKNEAADRLELLESWRTPIDNIVRGDPEYHVGAHLEFRQAGEITVGCRLSGKESEQGTQAFRIVPKDKVVTATLEPVELFIRNVGSSTATHRRRWIAARALEGRVGDRMFVPCGRYLTTNEARAADHPTSVVFAK